MREMMLKQAQTRNASSMACLPTPVASTERISAGVTESGSSVTCSNSPNVARSWALMGALRQSVSTAWTKLSLTAWAATAPCAPVQ